MRVMTTRMFTARELASMVRHDQHCETRPLSAREIRAADRLDRAILKSRELPPDNEDVRARDRVRNRKYREKHKRMEGVTV